MRIATLAVIAVCAAAPLFAAPTPRALTVEERVEAQRAIDEVYARYRGSAVSEAESDAIARRKVERFLRESAALERSWATTIDADALERELARIAASSQRPDILGELFRALGSDPDRVAESLVRPIVTDRLV